MYSHTHYRHCQERDKHIRDFFFFFGKTSQQNFLYNQYHVLLASKFFAKSRFDFLLLAGVLFFVFNNFFYYLTCYVLSLK